MTTQPGWYPDPAQPGAVRWWDGTQWSEHQAPAAPVVYSRPTEGMAIASLVSALLGAPIVPIILGHMARNRIRESGGMKDGDGLALAGIIIGWFYIAIFAVFILGFIALGIGAAAA